MEILVGLLCVSLLVYLGYKEWLWSLKERQSDKVIDLIKELEDRNEKERARVAKEQKSERKDLYDRLMSKGLQDYKTETQPPAEVEEEETEEEDYFPLTGVANLSEEDRDEIATGIRPEK